MLDNAKKLITAKDVFDNDFPLYNDKQRIKEISKSYKNMSIAEAFSTYYGISIADEISSNNSVNDVLTININNTYLGNVKSIDKDIIFEIPGVKEEIVNIDKISAYDIQPYLFTHNNQLYFKVKEKKNNKYYVSVLEAYYDKWIDQINQMIKMNKPINVHINSLVTGGYMCSTEIFTIKELTGRNYTHLVFIPGSHIVLNIERDFEQWIGKDVQAVPQKFAEFYKNYKTGEVENTLVCSRKKILQINGINNLYNIYLEYMFAKKNNKPYVSKAYQGTVTGIINSSKKTGIFVEIDNEYITGLMPVDSSEILDYKPGDKLMIGISKFEIQKGKEAFVHDKKGKNIIECNTRPVFELVCLI